MARQLARRQHRERLAGVLIAMVGVAVLVVAIIALRNPKQPTTSAGTDTRVVTATRSTGSGAASRTSSKSTSKSTSKPTSSRSKAAAVGSQRLIVLNDTRIAHLARTAAARFQSGGWTVASYDENYSNDIASTCAYYDPSVTGADAAALALQKQYPTIKRVLTRFAGLPSGPVVVVLTSDYAPN